MSSGTAIVQRALKHLSVHSPLQNAPPEAQQDAKETLNGMLAMWRSRFGIQMGTVVIDDLGEELSEPLDAKNDIEYCLAMSLAPFFPGAQVSPALPGLASKGWQNILAMYGNNKIPKKRPRSTLPRGQGNLRHGYFLHEYAFYPKGSEIG